MLHKSKIIYFFAMNPDKMVIKEGQSGIFFGFQNDLLPIFKSIIYVNIKYIEEDCYHPEIYGCRTCLCFLRQKECHSISTFFIGAVVSSNCKELKNALKHIVMVNFFRFMLWKTPDLQHSFTH